METELVKSDVPDDGSLEFRAGSKIGHEMEQPREKEVLGRRWRSICAHCGDSGLSLSGREQPDTNLVGGFVTEAWAAAHCGTARVCRCS